MQKILPAIMPYSFQDFQEKIEKVEDFASLVQVDVMDGVFVPSESWPYNGTDLDKFEDILKQKSGLPGWKKVNFVLDLMVSEVESKVYDWIDAGASRVTLHLESLHNQESSGIVAKLKEQYGDDLEVGLAISANTPNEKLLPFIDDIDFVQFMGIEKIGFQGQDFAESVLEKISDFKIDNPSIPVVVDGSVNKETLPKLAKAGADRFVVGSALFDANDIKAEYDLLSNLIQ